jgi:hypothetical protein
MQFFAHVIYKLTLSVDKIALKMSLDNFSIAQIKSPQPLQTVPTFIIPQTAILF